MKCPACHGCGIAQDRFFPLGTPIPHFTCPDCQGTGKATASPASRSTAPDQANPLVEINHHLKAIQETVRALCNAMDELHLSISQAGEHKADRMYTNNRKG